MQSETSIPIVGIIDDDQSIREVADAYQAIRHRLSKVSKHINEGMLADSCNPGLTSKKG